MVLAVTSNFQLSQKHNPLKLCVLLACIFPSSKKVSEWFSANQTESCTHQNALTKCSDRKTATVRIYIHLTVNVSIDGMLTIIGVLSSMVDIDDLSMLSCEPLDVLSWGPDLLTNNRFSHSRFENYWSWGRQKAAKH